MRGMIAAIVLLVAILVAACGSAAEPLERDASRGPVVDPYGRDTSGGPFIDPSG